MMVYLFEVWQVRPTRQLSTYWSEDAAERYARSLGDRARTTVCISLKPRKMFPELWKRRDSGYKMREER